MRGYNFSAGPAVLPEIVLQRAQDEMFDFRNSGVSIMEIGHRTDVFQNMLQQLENKIRKIMLIPKEYHVLFLAGGGQGQFSLIPMNLAKNNNAANYLISGIWSERAAKYASRIVEVNVVTTATLSAIPDSSTWKFNPNAAYTYYCPNETINGISFPQNPKNEVDIPLIADMTSSILFDVIDIRDFGLIFAAAQKNLGIAGITLLIIKDELLGQAIDTTPEVFNYTIQAKEKSCLNTIPTFPVYMMDLMIDWLEEQGGLEKINIINKRKAQKLYDCIDNSNGFYSSIVLPPYRSLINIPFNLPNDDLLRLFLKQSSQHGLKYLQGHKLVGGARASLYNAMPESGVDSLVDFMHGFAKTYG